MYYGEYGENDPIRCAFSKTLLLDHPRNRKANILSNLRLTSTGYFGLAHEATQPGDVIAILIRCSFPVVLYPHGEFYKVVGERYIHGLMDGEVLYWKEPGNALSDCLCLLG